jgi:hypothetical protein
MLSEDNGFSDIVPERIDEEGRVTFVGATRARSRLLVGTSREPYCRKLRGSSRLYKPGFPGDTPRAQIEVGLSRDVDVYSHLTETEQPLADDGHAPSERQDFLWANCLSYLPLVAESRQAGSGSYWLRTPDRSMTNLGALSEGFEVDLAGIGGLIADERGVAEMLPSQRIGGLFMVGAASVVLPEDDDLQERLVEPYNRSGIFLVPVISGFPMVYFSGRLLPGRAQGPAPDW